jgi:hypothetical protein
MPEEEVIERAGEASTGTLIETKLIVLAGPVVAGALKGGVNAPNICKT